jgi:hypothetical protein
MKKDLYYLSGPVTGIGVEEAGRRAEPKAKRNILIIGDYDKLENDRRFL